MQERFAIRRAHGLASTERPDPMGRAIAALTAVAGASALDRLHLRKPTERALFLGTRAGFQAIGATTSQAARLRPRRASSGQGKPGGKSGLFDLTPTTDEQLLVDAATEVADGFFRTDAAASDRARKATDLALKSAAAVTGAVTLRAGQPADVRTPMAATLVTEALARGDMGLAVAALATPAVATAVARWGTVGQQRLHLGRLTGHEPVAAALVIAEPRPLFDATELQTTATRQGKRFVLDGEKCGVVRGAEVEVFLVAAMLDGAPRLFLVDADTDGVETIDDPLMGLRAAATSRLVLNGVAVDGTALLGSAEDYLECLTLSRLAWCALAVGTGRAALDHSIEFANAERDGGEPLSHHQGYAFLVSRMAMELEGMRLVTYKAASRATAGLSFTREVGLARRLCVEAGMTIGSDAVQLLGDSALTGDYPVERWFRDLRAVGAMEGAVLV
ncbi:acyl-CoA dehydrogenase [Nocardioides cavernaquae]|uniref:Acyl-CoA dehydrogenase n=2 Tax=Nocardioides cavernaquae TaxID=2321396 RepID=A0A3A5HDI8_9ACTN|nr:acyl-CoA dehydrogenase [Nocardioides cavernaquae]